MRRACSFKPPCGLVARSKQRRSLSLRSAPVCGPQPTAPGLSLSFMRIKPVPAPFFAFCVATNKRMLLHTLRWITVWLQLCLTCCLSGTALTRDLHELALQPGSPTNLVFIKHLEQIRSGISIWPMCWRRSSTLRYAPSSVVFVGFNWSLQWFCMVMTFFLGDQSVSQMFFFLDWKKSSSWAQQWWTEFGWNFRASEAVSHGGTPICRDHCVSRGEAYPCNDWKVFTETLQLQSSLQQFLYLLFLRCCDATTFAEALSGPESSSQWLELQCMWVKNVLICSLQRKAWHLSWKTQKSKLGWILAELSGTWGSARALRWEWGKQAKAAVFRELCVEVKRKRKQSHWNVFRLRLVKTDQDQRQCMFWMVLWFGQRAGPRIASVWVWVAPKPSGMQILPCVYKLAKPKPVKATKWPSNPSVRFQFSARALSIFSVMSLAEGNHFPNLLQMIHEGSPNALSWWCSTWSPINMISTALLFILAVPPVGIQQTHEGSGWNILPYLSSWFQTGRSTVLAMWQSAKAGIKRQQKCLPTVGGKEGYRKCSSYVCGNLALQKRQTWLTMFSQVDDWSDSMMNIFQDSWLPRTLW